MITPRPDSERRRRAAAALIRLRPVLAEQAERTLGRAESVGFLARLDLWFLDFHAPLEALYGDDDGDELVGRLVALALAGPGSAPPSCARPTGVARSSRAGTRSRAR